MQCKKNKCDYGLINKYMKRSASSSSFKQKNSKTIDFPLLRSHVANLSRKYDKFQISINEKMNALNEAVEKAKKDQAKQDTEYNSALVSRCCFFLRLPFLKSHTFFSTLNYSMLRKSEERKCKSNMNQNCPPEKSSITSMESF